MSTRQRVCPKRQTRSKQGMQVRSVSPFSQITAARGLSVRDAERLARSAQRPPGRRPAERDRDVTRMEEELSDRLGLSVAIQSGKNGAGKLIIGFGSLDQLDEVLAKLTA